MTSAPNILIASVPTLGAQAATFGGDGESFFLMLLQTLFVLGLVCGLAYLIFRWVLPRLAVTRSTNSMVRVVDVVGLDARKRLYVIEVAGRWMLVASSEAGVQMVSELDAEAAEEAAQSLERARQDWHGWKTFGSAARASFAERLARLMNKRR
jgi:flagellar protein FliO/FliZ